MQLANFSIMRALRNPQCKGDKVARGNRTFINARRFPSQFGWPCDPQRLYFDPYAREVRALSGQYSCARCRPALCDYDRNIRWNYRMGCAPVQGGRARELVLLVCVRRRSDLAYCLLDYARDAANIAYRLNCPPTPSLQGRKEARPMKTAPAKARYPTLRWRKT